MTTVRGRSLVRRIRYVRVGATLVVAAATGTWSTPAYVTPTTPVVPQTPVVEGATATTTRGYVPIVHHSIYWAGPKPDTRTS